jgi:hypothetical protein
MSSSVEILGQWITLPDPDSVASLSNHYYGVSTTLADTKSQLSAIGSPQAAARWTGLAADAFAGRLGALPGELEQAWQSYNAVARALSGYSSNLRPVVAALRSLASQAEEAQGTLNATQAARDQAVRTGQESATGVWNTRLVEAKAAVSALARRRSSLLTELDQLSAECVRQIHQAGPETVHQDLLSDLKRYAADGARLYWRADKDVFHFELKVAEDLTIGPFVSLVKDADYLYDHRHSWEAWGTVLDDISGVLAICAVVCAPFPPAAGVLLLASMGVGAVGAAADFRAAQDHEQGASYLKVGLDVGSLALMGSGRVLGKGVDALADNEDAKATGSLLWNSGVKHFFSLDEDSSPGVIKTYEDTIKVDLNAGVDPSKGPAAVPLEHAEWVVGKLGDGVTVAQGLLQDAEDKHVKGHGS